MREYDEDEMREEEKSVSLQTDAEFKAYIEEHTGPDMKNKSPREKLDNLAVAATAYMFMKAKSKKFNASVIHRKADKIRQTLDLDDLHEKDIDAMLSSPEKLRKGINHQLTKLYAPKEGFNDYVKNMKTLADNMPMDDSRSAEYNTMAKAIKDVAALQPISGDINDKSALPNSKKDEIISKNYKLMQSIEKNIKGRERVRRTAAGVEHFNTALDGLSIMNDANPALADKTYSIVKKINYSRGAESDRHKDFVDIKDFGAERSVKASAARAQKIRDKRLERTMDKDKLKNKKMEQKLGM